MKAIKILSLVLAISLLNACKNGRFKGTDTGNPLTQMSPARAIATELCDKISVCSGSLDGDSCVDSLMSTPGFAPALGFENYSTLDQVEQDTSINFDTTKVNSCIDEISQVSCQTVTVEVENPVAGRSDSGSADVIITSTSKCSSISSSP